MLRAFFVCRITNFIFFKQKTAYEMRMSDWSSDVCTSDLMTKQARRTGESFGLILVDIDDLKRTNDTLGHDAGDALLCGFAQRFASCAPADAMIGRLGGDEFGMIAPSLASSAALSAWSAELLGGVRVPYVHNGRSLDYGRSEEHTSELQSLMRIAYAVF